MAWQVILPLPLPPYDFAPPHGYEGAVPIGHRVMVPWQGVPKVGIVLGESASHSHTLREVLAVLPQHVTPEFLQALSAYCEFTHTPMGLLASDLLSRENWTPTLEHWVRPVSGADLSAFELELQHTWQKAPEHVQLDLAREQGLLEEMFKPVIASRTVYVPVSGSAKLGPKQKQAWYTLRQLGEVESFAAWARAAEVSVSAVSAVVAKGYAAASQRPLPPPELFQNIPNPLSDVPYQEFERLHGGYALERHSHLKPHLEQVLAQGKSVLYLCSDHYRLNRALQSFAHLGALLYSSTMPDQKRQALWEVCQQHPQLLLGMYSAVSVPLPNLGLLILEEEGSDGYKLISGSKVFVPDIALKLAKLHGAKVIFTGSSPSVEALAVSGVMLPPPKKRIHVVSYADPEPSPQIGPLSDLRPQKDSYPLSHDLKKVLLQVAERGKQAVVLAPRKGYSALLRCKSCQYIPFCPHCDVALKFHAERKSLECNQCGYHHAVPHVCPKCLSELWQPKGPGTEWLQQEIQKLIKAFPVHILDKNHHAKLEALHAGEAGIVVATQAILQHPPLPKLALIAVSLADTWTQFPDFRSDERFHTLLWQLLEWNTGHSPLMLIQTFQPENVILHSVQQHNAEYYPQKLWNIRKALGYPPFEFVVQAEIASRDVQRSKTAAFELVERLKAQGYGHEVLGPAPAPITKVQDMYLYHILLKSPKPERLKKMLDMLQYPKVRIRLDYNPRSLGM